MKHTKLVTVVILMVVVFISSQAFAQESQVDWDSYSENLTIALKTGHPGLREAALQRIIQYSDNLNMEEGVCYIGRIFNNATVTKERKLALVALAKINSLKSMAYIYQGMINEDDDSIKKEGCCVLNDFRSANQDITENDFQLALLEQ